MMSERSIDPVKLQSTLAAARARAELGRLMDLGPYPGAQAGGVISMRQEHSRLGAIIDANRRAAARLDLAREVLARMTARAASFTDFAPRLAPEKAREFLESFTADINTCAGGVYLFAGVNTDVRPLANYFDTPIPPARQAVDEAFHHMSGVMPGNPAAAAITPEGMQSFLGHGFARLFDTPSWLTVWSAAPNSNTRSRISNQELIETSINANEPAFRQLACAYTMTAGLGLETLQPAVARIVTDAATRLAGEAIEGLNALDARLEAMKDRIADASEMMAVQMDLMASHIGLLEAADGDEVSARVERLREQLNKAYALTQRAHKLSQLQNP